MITINFGGCNDDDIIATTTVLEFSVNGRERFGRSFASGENNESDNDESPVDLSICGEGTPSARPKTHRCCHFKFCEEKCNHRRRSRMMR